jgi:autotransporter-associated beta strand protein
VNNATWDIATGETLTVDGTVSGPGGVTKNGNGTLVLSGNNTYDEATVINAGTLEAASANALGRNATVTVNGGTLLVTKDNALQNKNIQLSTTTLGMKIEGNYSGTVGSLTLSANSSIDLGTGSVEILFQGLVLNSYFLKIYNWTGTTRWDGGTGNDTDKVFLLPAIDPSDLNKISFYSDDYGTDSFLGTGFDLGLKATGFAAPWNEGNQIIPVPEPETYATGLLLLLGGAWWMMKKNRRVI